MAVPWQVPEQLSCVSLPSLLPACMRQVDLPRDTEPLMPCKMGVDSLAMPQILSARKGMYQFFLRIEPPLAMAGSLKVHWESSYGTTSVGRSCHAPYVAISLHLVGASDRHCDGRLADLLHAFHSYLRESDASKMQREV